MTGQAQKQPAVTASKQDSAIEAKGVVNRFGKQLIHNGVDLTLKKGEILGIVGGSGSGKSVLLRTMLGLHKPNEGQVLVDGRDVTSLNEDERKQMAQKWGVAFQEGALFSGLNVLDNISLPLREHTKLNGKDIESLALFKLGIVGLKPEAATKFPSELSGGMVRRAGLARALALDPGILFLDEPTSGLDPIAAAAFDQLILELRRVLTLSVLIITHDLDTLVTICDRIAMLVDKKVIVGTLDEMMACDVPQVKEYFRGPRMRAVQKEPHNADKDAGQGDKQSPQEKK
ncbi:MAG: ABC transporter ATP-binding protein [Micavibrio sp.]|nr:ABC transporter ATP-binding protein [Micavibrio sp.]